MKCNIKECKGSCCYNVPIDKSYLSAYRKKIVTPVIRKMDAGGNMIVPITSEDLDNNKCPFLTDNYKCNIYESRPDICRKFGTGKHELLSCAYLGQTSLTRQIETCKDVLKRIK